MGPGRRVQIIEELAEQLYIDSGRGTPVTVSWNSPNLPGPIRRSWKASAAASVAALERLGHLR